MYHVEYMYMWFMSRHQGRAQGLTPKGKLFMGVSSMCVGVVGVWLHHHKVLIIHLLYILIAHMMQVSLTGVRISFVPRPSQFSWSPSIWTP